MIVPSISIGAPPEQARTWHLPQRWHPWQFIGGFTCRSFWIAEPIFAALVPSGASRSGSSPRHRPQSCVVGSLWHFRHQPIDSSLSCRTTFISFTCPWHETHDTPLFTWTAWLKYAYSGSLWTRFHSTGLPVSKLVADRREQRAGPLHVRLLRVVAVHARLRRGHVRVRRLEHRLVAVGAIHAELADVQLVRERHRLLGRVADAGVARQRVVVPAGDEEPDRDDEPDRRAGGPVRRAIARRWRALIAPCEFTSTRGL